jgi:hypothetical protein
MALMAALCAVSGCASTNRQALDDWHIERIGESLYRVRSWKPVFPIPGFDEGRQTEAYAAEDACLREATLRHRFADSRLTLAFVLNCMQAKGWTIEEIDMPVLGR